MRLMSKTLSIITLLSILPAIAFAAPSKEQQAAVDSLRKAGFLAQQVALDNENFDINFKLAGKPITDDHLKSLKAVGGLVHSLNLAGTDIKDGKLGVLNDLKNLKRLHLEKTEVTDAGLDHVKSLSHLEYLNLYGTKVTDEGLKKLEGLAKLQKLFLWQTEATEDGAKSLFAKLPNTYINLGSDKPVIGPAYASTKKEDAAAIAIVAAGSPDDQELCPIMVETEIDTEEVVEYGGMKIFMCCGSCVKVWKKNPNYYLKAALSLKLLPQFGDMSKQLADVKLMKQRFCPLRDECIVGPESPFVEYKGKKIHFFRASDIERKWNKNPDELFAKAREEGLLPQFDEGADVPAVVKGGDPKDQVMCPVMVETEIDEEEYVEYEGVKIFMCCGSCTKAWKKNPKYYLKAALSLKLLPQFGDMSKQLADVELMKQRFCPLRSECIITPESPSVEYKGKKIYFFRASDIERKWKKKPDELFAEAREEGLLPQFD